jgi:hypothetical protein
VIAGRGGDNTALLLISGELSERITRAAFLKTSRPLQVVELAENFHAGDFAEWDGGPTRRIINRISNTLTRRFDVLKSDHETQLSIAAWAAANRAIGIRNGLQLT